MHFCPEFFPCALLLVESYLRLGWDDCTLVQWDFRMAAEPSILGAYALWAQELQDTADFAGTFNSTFHWKVRFDTGCLDVTATTEAVNFSSRKLHYLLANLTTGSARLIVGKSNMSNGFETWCRMGHDMRHFLMRHDMRHFSPSC